MSPLLLYFPDSSKQSPGRSAYRGSRPLQDTQFNADSWTCRVNAECQESSSFQNRFRARYGATFWGTAAFIVCC